MAVQPICPRQDNAPLIGEEGVFNTTWWLFFNRLASFTVEVPTDTGIAQDNVPVSFT